MPILSRARHCMGRTGRRWWRQPSKSGSGSRWMLWARGLPAGRNGEARSRARSALFDNLRQSRLRLRLAAPVAQPPGAGL
jgi:hypothetical protein